MTPKHRCNNRFNLTDIVSFLPSGYRQYLPASGRESCKLAEFDPVFTPGQVLTEPIICGRKPR